MRWSLTPPLTASTFNQLGQYANSPGNGAFCYAELAVSSLAVAGSNGHPSQY